MSLASPLSALSALSALALALAADSEREAPPPPCVRARGRCCCSTLAHGTRAVSPNKASAPTNSRARARRRASGARTSRRQQQPQQTKRARRVQQPPLLLRFARFCAPVVVAFARAATYEFPIDCGFVRRPLHSRSSREEGAAASWRGEEEGAAREDGAGPSRAGARRQGPRDGAAAAVPAAQGVVRRGRGGEVGRAALVLAGARGVEAAQGGAARVRGGGVRGAGERRRRR